jgi:Rad3-related DNA helicase
MSFVALTINRENLEELLVDPPTSFEIIDVLIWLKTVYAQPLRRNTEALRAECEKFVRSGANHLTPDFVETCRRYKTIDRHCCNVNRTVGHARDTGWVVDQSGDNFTLTPLSARGFIHDSFISRNEKNLFMTATVLDRDAFEHELELENKKALFISLPSPFEAKKRQVFFIPSCKLKREDLPGTIQDLAKGVRIILDHHPDDKGIIFVSSYAQSNELIRQMKDKRLITHLTSDGKQLLMSTHAGSRNSVIVSPSMHVGTDLKDDLSRFQVIAKLPFPSLGIRSVKTRSEQDPRWYAYKTALTLVQASGRSVRSEDDHAVTYILDTDFSWFLRRWRCLFPEWWLNALRLP